MKIWSTAEDEEDTENVINEFIRTREEKDKEIVALRTQVLVRERAHIEFLEKLVLELIKRKEEPASAPKLSPALQAYMDKKSNNTASVKELAKKST